MYREPKAPQEKRLTRGKHNPLPDEITNQHMREREKDSEGNYNYNDEFDEGEQQPD